MAVLLFVIVLTIFALATFSFFSTMHICCTINSVLKYWYYFKDRYTIFLADPGAARGGSIITSVTD